MNISFNFFDSWEQSEDQSGRRPNQTVGDFEYLTLICQYWTKNEHWKPCKNPLYKNSTTFCI